MYIAIQVNLFSKSVFVHASIFLISFVNNTDSQPIQFAETARMRKGFGASELGMDLWVQSGSHLIVWVLMKVLVAVTSCSHKLST